MNEEIQEQLRKSRHYLILIISKAYPTHYRKLALKTSEPQTILQFEKHSKPPENPTRNECRENENR